MEKIDKKIVGILVFVSLVVFTNTAVNALYGSSSKEDIGISNNVGIQILHTDSLPMRIEIPSIGVDAKVQHVGIGKTGNMAVPRGYEDVGWYRYGPRPGERGSAVMAGHVNNGLGLGGVFNNLKNIKIGDQVLYTAADGTKLVFEVEDIQKYDVSAAPTKQIFNRMDAARLNLITCDGEWSEQTKSYNKRLVVFTKLLAEDKN